MAARKKTPKKKAEEEVYYITDEDDEADENVPTSIETEVVLDAFDFMSDEEDSASEPMYHITFHAELPEHIAQHLFAQYVQNGRMVVEFQPADPEKRRTGTLVRR